MSRPQKNSLNRKSHANDVALSTYPCERITNRDKNASILKSVNMLDNLYRSENTEFRRSRKGEISTLLLHVLSVTVIITVIYISTVGGGYAMA